VTQKHSPEPWTVIPYHEYNHDAERITHTANVQDARGLIIGSLYDTLPNWERIVACVNFCRQFPTDWLQGRQLVRIHDASELVGKSLADIEGFDGLVPCKLIPVAREPA
jgi:hypothetical protein